MVVRPTDLGLVVIGAEPRGDERGFLARTYCELELADHGLDLRRYAPPPRHTRALPEACVERMGAALATARTPVVSGDSHLLGHDRADEGLQMFLTREAQPRAAARPAQIMGIARFASVSRPQLAPRETVVLFSPLDLVAYRKRGHRADVG
jgi:hypothetical protein